MSINVAEAKAGREGAALDAAHQIKIQGSESRWSPAGAASSPHVSPVPPASGSSSRRSAPGPRTVRTRRRLPEDGGTRPAPADRRRARLPVPKRPRFFCPSTYTYAMSEQKWDIGRPVLPHRRLFWWRLLQKWGGTSPLGPTGDPFALVGSMRLDRPMPRRDAGSCPGETGSRSAAPAAGRLHPRHDSARHHTGGSRSY